MYKKKISKTKDIEPGMVVEATRGDLGEEDVSKPKVAEVVEGEQGRHGRAAVCVCMVASLDEGSGLSKRLPRTSG